jgi:hypothetical protein
MDVRISDLRAVAERLLEHLQETDREVISIDHDYYWVIPKEQRYEPDEEPKEFTLGQLSDDFRELMRIKNGEVEPIGYALVWLSSLLRVVGEKTIG